VTGAQGGFRELARATDTHIHIYDPGFQTDPKNSLTSSGATGSDCRALQKRLGLA
jgi:hypothetical protein